MLNDSTPRHHPVPLPDSPGTSPTTSAHRENRVAWTIWLSYGAFYFCRTNISAAVPGMTDSVANGGLGLTATEVSLILGATKIAYAAGQFLNGQLSERYSPRLLLAMGMLGSAVLNVVFGFSTALYFLIFLWASNGFCQSLGWTPCVRVLANWIPVYRRGKVIGFVGTGYQVATVLSFVVAGQAAEYFGWRGALYVPAAILVAAAVVMLLFLEESPETRRTGGDPLQDGDDQSSHIVGHSFAANLWLTITNPTLWLLGTSLGMLNACRYGFLDWGLTHLRDIQQTSVGTAALKYAVLPIGAVAGSYLAGWATDRFFNSRRAPVTCMLLLILGTLCLAYDHVARTSVPATLVLLVVIGFCIYGPQVLLVGSAPADLARKGTSAAAAGFVNAMGYVGAATGDYFTGRMLDESGWQDTIYLWSGWAFAAAIAAGLLWNATSSNK